MHGSTKPIRVGVLRIVIICVPTKPQRHQGSKQKQKKGNIHSRFNKKGIDHFK
jgi:hypothetical protein